jgi:hypothetical protein
MPDVFEHVEDAGKARVIRPKVQSARQKLLIAAP